MAEELDPCLHLSVQRKNAGWFCQGCREQFAPAADIRRVDDINARFAVKEWARKVDPMREVENAQHAVPRMESQDDRPITPEMVKISDLESRLRWLEADKIAPLEKNIANHKDIIREMRERERSVLAALAEHFGKITSLEKTVSDLDERRAIMEKIVGQGDAEMSHSRMISNLTQAVMRLEKQVGISQMTDPHSGHLGKRVSIMTIHGDYDILVGKRWRKSFDKLWKARLYKRWLQWKENLADD